MKVFCISPHTDDVELSMGGTLIKHVRARHEVKIISCTLASAPEGSPSDIGIHEQGRVASFLGVDSVYDHGLLSYTRRLAERRQHLLDWFLMLKSLHNPDVVYLPSSWTTHQDHATVYLEGFRAFKDRNLYGYEDPWNMRSFTPTKFVEFDSGVLQKKIRAVEMFKSQAHRPYMAAESITALARSRAIAIGSIAFAEAFEVIREVDRIE